MPDPNTQFIEEVDASNIGVGAVIYQWSELWRTLATGHSNRNQIWMVVFQAGCLSHTASDHKSLLGATPHTLVRTLEFLQHCFWWPAMDMDGRTYVTACQVCAQNNDP